MRQAGYWLEHLKKHFPLALEGQDLEGVHQVRVAARRLRVYVELLGWRVLRDDLSRLFRGTSRVRDLEVALSHPLPPGFRDHLKESLVRTRRALPELLASSWTRPFYGPWPPFPFAGGGVADPKAPGKAGRGKAFRIPLDLPP
ncbi:CHAD domain-containing protein [Thermus caldifontis]|uniref:CHAD domain-containing protein n=1 Tax=Thermus caldifontis TaxID=1930763 RepID=UPI000DF40CAA|nr:CHAD domain-containing protein [Thermus caldifontis]